MMIVNALAFQLCWFACVLGGSYAALLAVGLFALWHLPGTRKPEWLLLTMVTLCGLLWDTLLMHLGVIRFTQPQLLIPLWLVLLWLAFAMTLWHSLAWCSRRLWLAAPCGAVAAPLSYSAGSQLGALELNSYALPVISSGWALLMSGVAVVTGKYGIPGHSRSFVSGEPQDD